MKRNRGLMLFFIITMTTQYFEGCESFEFKIQNKCGYTIWPATLSGKESPELSSSGFELKNGAFVSLQIPRAWSGRIWARTHCFIDDTETFRCGTGDCGTGQVTCNGTEVTPQPSLVDFTISQRIGGQDFYDISLVNGYNLPIAVTPQGGSSLCKAISCRANLNPTCPPQLQVKDLKGSVIGCQSACSVFKQPQYCCTGAFGSSKACHPTTYSKYFKDRCPQVFSYAYDDLSSIFTCTGEASYLITFCP